MKYNQLSQEERHHIAALRSERLSRAEIGRRVGRHPSTISREIRRNAYPTDGNYRASHAGKMARGRRSRVRRGSRFAPEDWKRVEELLRRDFSPEQVSGHLKRCCNLSISHETIYGHVWRDMHRAGDLHTHLRGAKKLRRKRYGRYDSRGKLAGKRMIGTRPQSVERRIERGHWEIDTVMGSGKGCIVTLVERVSGFVMIGKLANKTAALTARKTCRFIQAQSELQKRGEYEDAKEEIKRPEAWITRQRHIFVLDVELGSWSGMSTRKMAEECCCLDFYNYVYQGFSGCGHSMWHHIGNLMCASAIVPCTPITVSRPPLNYCPIPITSIWRANALRRHLRALIRDRHR